MPCLILIFDFTKTTYYFFKKRATGDGMPVPRYAIIPDQLVGIEAVWICISVPIYHIRLPAIGVTDLVQRGMMEMHLLLEDA